jgi:oligopeptidase B
MVRRSFLSGALLVVVVLAQSATAQIPKPPVADVKPVKHELHGHVRVDNYAWMRERDSSKVLDYLKAENAYTDAVMAGTKPLEEKLYQEIIARIKQDDSSVPAAENGYEYYSRFKEGQQYPQYFRRRLEENAKEELLLDVNKLAEGKTFCSVPGVNVNRQNDLAAFAIDTVGRMIYSVRFKHLDTGEMLNEEIRSITANLEWAEDGKTLFYTRQDPETLRPYQVYRHTIGTSPDKDVLVYEEKDDTFNCSVSKSRSKKYLLIRSDQTLTNEVRFLDAENPTGEWKVFQPRRRNHEYSVDHIGDRFYIRTNDGAKNFRLMKTPEDNTTQENWQEVVPHRPDVLLERFALFTDYLVVQERRSGLSHLRIVPWSGEPEHEVDFDEPAYFLFPTPTPEADTPVLRFVYTSLRTPISTFDYDMKSRTKTLRKQEPVLGGFDRANYVTERLFATARDGTKVPISLVYRRDIKRDGQNPCLLYGYGAYGIELDPYFDSSRLSLIDRGFVFAIAHIRGGQIMGRQWYEDGKLLKKMNTFTDFIDCGEFLIRERLVDPKQLYAMSASAGGLLLGAVVNMRPDLFAGVVAEVPFVDLMNTMLDDTIPLTTAEYDEWGNPHHKEYYEYMLSYSPYDNVAAKGYPNLLVTSGLHDSQVQYWEPTKWVAKLRALKTDDSLLLLKTNMDAGHGGASGRFEQHKLTALQYAFLLRLAGIAE